MKRKIILFCFLCLGVLTLHSQTLINRFNKIKRSSVSPTTIRVNNLATIDPTLTKKTTTYQDGSKVVFKIVRKTDENQTEPIDNSTYSQDPVRRNCTKITKSYTATNIDQGILDASVMRSINLGSVYSLSDLKNGNPRSIDDNRANITLQMSDKSSNPIEIQNPNFHLLSQKIQSLREEPFTSRPIGNGQLLSTTLITSSSDFDFSAAASYTGLGISLKDKFSYNQSSSTTKYLLSYFYPIYNIQAFPDKSLLFKSDDSRNNDGSLVYVDNVVYGVRLMVYFEVNADYKLVKNAFEGSGFGITANCDVSLKTKLQKTKFTTYLYGARNPIQFYDNVGEAIRGTGNLINDIVNNTSLKPSDLGLPISYSLRFVADNSIAATSINLQNATATICSPRSLKVNIVKIHGNHADLDLDGNISLEAFNNQDNAISDIDNKNPSDGFVFDSNHRLHINGNQGSIDWSGKTDKNHKFDISAYEQGSYIEINTYLTDVRTLGDHYYISDPNMKNFTSTADPKKIFFDGPDGILAMIANSPDGIYRRTIKVLGSDSNIKLDVEFSIVE